jgi:hypothetical protein
MVMNKRPYRSTGTLLQKIKSRYAQTKEVVPPELEKALKECTDLEQLKELLFATKDLDAASLKAFDRRIEQLQRNGK